MLVKEVEKHHFVQFLSLSLPLYITSINQFYLSFVSPQKYNHMVIPNNTVIYPKRLSIAFHNIICKQYKHCGFFMLSFVPSVLWSIIAIVNTFLVRIAKRTKQTAFHVTMIHFPFLMLCWQLTTWCFVLKTCCT